MLVSSYNVRGLPKSKSALALRMDLSSLFKQCDILLCQETWYCSEQLKYLNSLSGDFYGSGIATRNLSDGILHGHPPGGVAIFWKRHLNDYVRHLVFDDVNWCNGIEINIGGKSLVLLNVYLPYQCYENEEKFIECLGSLMNIINDLNCSCLSIVGDWNANLAG